MSSKILSSETLVDAPCPGCGAIGTVARVRCLEVVEVRGLSFEAETMSRLCGVCGASFSNTLDPDWRPAAYARYRREKGYAPAEKIVAWCAANGLDDLELSAMTGVRPGSLERVAMGGLLPDRDEVLLTAFVAT